MPVFSPPAVILNAVNTASSSVPTVLTSNASYNARSPIAGTLLQLVSADAAQTVISLDGYGATPRFFFRRAAGTSTTPTATASGQSLGQFSGAGYGTTGFAAVQRAVLNMIAAELWSDTAQGTNIAFSTTAPTTTTTAVTAQVYGGGGFGTYRGGGAALSYVPPAFVAAGTAVASTMHMVSDTVTAGGASTTVTLSGDAAFASANYTLVIEDVAVPGVVIAASSQAAGSFAFVSTNAHVYAFTAIGV